MYSTFYGTFGMPKVPIESPCNGVAHARMDMDCVSNWAGSLFPIIPGSIQRAYCLGGRNNSLKGHHRRSPRLVASFISNQARNVANYRLRQHGVKESKDKDQQ